MRKAIVRNSVIENIAVDPSPDWIPPVGTTAVDDPSSLAQIGGSFANGIFTAAPPQPVKNPADAVDVVLLKIAFNHENRIRALEAKAPITIDQFKTALNTLLS